jgi:hypothetical protein
MMLHPASIQPTILSYQMQTEVEDAHLFGKDLPSSDGFVVAVANRL